MCELPDCEYYFDGKLQKDPKPKSREERELILNTHPLFTGVCPQCKYSFPKNTKPDQYSVCPSCGWEDAIDLSKNTDFGTVG